MTRYSSMRNMAQRYRQLWVEGLEHRTVLSVCGVECGVENGQLSIEGTSADDQIAVRYDSAPGWFASSRAKVSCWGNSRLPICNHCTSTGRVEMIDLSLIPIFPSTCD